MIINVHSFIAGLHTGLRLGRDPIKHTPPVPHDQYILTEYGRPLITEYSQPQVESDATIYHFFGRYRCGDTFMSIQMNYGGSPYNPEGGGYFFWQEGDTLGVVFYGFGQFYGRAGGIYTVNEDGEDEVRVGFAFLNIDQRIGDLYYRTMMGTPWTNYIPDDMIPFEGTRGELLSFLESTDYDYIITE